MFGSLCGSGRGDEGAVRIVTVFWGGGWCLREKMVRDVEAGCVLVVIPGSDIMKTK